MEYCAGGDLFGFIEKRGFALKEDLARSFINKILIAVFYLHQYGIVHRDLKPENIMMTDDTDKANLKLLDFGLSKICNPGDLCTEPFGTIVIIFLIFSHMLLQKYF
jgi:serine/threonine protein kinase